MSGLEIYPGGGIYGIDGKLTDITKSKNNVVDINNDSLFYIKGEGGTFKGVGDSSGMIEFIDVDNDWIGVYAECDGTIEKHKFKELCIAWLAINYPESLAIDD